VIPISTQRFLTLGFAADKLLFCPLSCTEPSLPEGNFVRAQARHQLKQDTFSRVTMEAAEKTADWTLAHRSAVIIVGIVVAVLLAVGLGGWYYLSQQDQKASLDLTDAIRTLNTPLRPAGTPEQPDFPTYTSFKERTDAGRKQLQAILDRYPHTRTADMARYLLGTTAADLSDNAAAERDFKEVSSSGNRELASMAKAALASLYGDTNRPKEATAIYQDLINKPTTSVSKVSAQLQLAELYQSTNQPLDAKRMYEQVKKENPGTDAGQLATQKLAQLK
jgi:tetratricopeptide (TPR) repeat protein